MIAVVEVIEMTVVGIEVTTEIVMATEVVIVVGTGNDLNTV